MVVEMTKKIRKYKTKFEVNVKKMNLSDLNKLNKIQVKKTVSLSSKSKNILLKNVLNFANFDKHIYQNDNDKKTRYKTKFDFDKTQGIDFIERKVNNLIFNKSYLLELSTQSKLNWRDDVIQDVKLHLIEFYYNKGIKILDTWTLAREVYKIASRSFRSYIVYTSKKQSIEYDSIFKSGKKFSSREVRATVDIEAGVSNSHDWIKTISNSAEVDFLKQMEEGDKKQAIAKLLESCTERQKNIINRIMDGQQREKGIINDSLTQNDKRSLQNKLLQYLS